MKMRLLSRLSAADGLVNERQCTVIKIVPHKDEFDQDRPVPTHFELVHLKYMLRGIWVSFDDYEDAPLAKEMLPYVNCAEQSDEKAEEEAKDFAAGLARTFHVEAGQLSRTRCDTVAIPVDTCHGMNGHVSARIDLS